MNTENTLLDLNEMLDMDESLDDFAEAPDYLNPPAGDYRLKVTKGEIKDFSYEATDKREAQSGQNIVLTIAVVETKELVKDDEPPVPEGSLFTKKYKGDRDGLGKFKRDFKKIMKLESLAGITLGNMLDLLSDDEGDTSFNGRISYGKFGEIEFMNLRFMPE